MSACAAALAFTAALGPAAAAHGQEQGEPPLTTLQRTITGGDPDEGFQSLRFAPGEQRLVREELAAAARGRAGQRESLLYFGQLTDFQLADEESPARVEFFDMTANPPFPPPFSAAHRPQEALTPHVADAGIRAMNALLRSPVPSGDGGRAKLAFTLLTGDLADSQQLNESAWVRTLLEGGTVHPNSGSPNPADYAACPPGTPGSDEAARYTGVQDYDDYVEGNQYYDPDVPAGIWRDWPRYPGLMDRAQAPFPTDGSAVPTYIAFGNHDALAQGNAAVIAPYEAIALGCAKPLVPAQNQFDLAGTLDPTYLGGLLASDPSKVALVPPDPERRYVSKPQFRDLFADPDTNDHGFGYIDESQLAASAGNAGYYSWSPAPGFRFIALDTVSEGGVPGPSAEGNLDDPQFGWLEGQLQAADAAGQLVVVFSHHPITSQQSPVPDEAAPPCTVADSHGHDVNPGCDRDPRLSTPIHLGDEVRDLLLAHPNVIAYVAGHTHEHRVTAYERSDGGGGFWSIETASHVDWPPQNRVIEIMDNGDGTLSIFGTVLDVDAQAAAPAPGTEASQLGKETLASIGRTLSYNDPQVGQGSGDGQPGDRNVELLLPDPRE